MTGARDGAATKKASGVFELAVEVAADPAEEEKGEGKGGSGGGDGEGFGFPAVVEAVVEDDEQHSEDADEPDKSADGHYDIHEGSAFVLAGESGGSMGESGHFRGAQLWKKIWLWRGGVNKERAEI